jgi:hypothetical protein
MENLKDKLPKKYASMIESIDIEDGLIDDCKYMVYLKDGFEWSNDGQTFPAKSIKEIREMMEAVDKTETKEPTTTETKEPTTTETPSQDFYEGTSQKFYEGNLRCRAIDFLYRNNRNYHDESEIKKAVESFRRIDLSKTK